MGHPSERHCFTSLLIILFSVLPWAYGDERGEERRMEDTPYFIPRPIRHEDSRLVYLAPTTLGFS